MKNKNENRMTVKEAAELMGVSELFIRFGIRNGTLPIGYAIKMSSKWTFYIQRNKFEAFMRGEEICG